MPFTESLAIRLLPGRLRRNATLTGSDWLRHGSFGHTWMCLGLTPKVAWAVLGQVQAEIGKDWFGSEHSGRDLNPGLTPPFPISFCNTP